MPQLLRPGTVALRAMSALVSSAASRNKLAAGKIQTLTDGEVAATGTVALRATGCADFS